MDHDSTLYIPSKLSINLPPICEQSSSAVGSIRFDGSVVFTDCERMPVALARLDIRSDGCRKITSSFLKMAAWALFRTARTAFPKKKFFPVSSCAVAKIHLWDRFLNPIFNKVDEKRIEEFGPDRTAAEWILRYFLTRRLVLISCSVILDSDSPLSLTLVGISRECLLYRRFEVSLESSFHRVILLRSQTFCVSEP